MMKFSSNKLSVDNLTSQFIKSKSFDLSTLISLIELFVNYKEKNGAEFLLEIARDKFPSEPALNFWAGKVFSIEEKKSEENTPSVSSVFLKSKL